MEDRWVLRGGVGIGVGGRWGGGGGAPEEAIGPPVQAEGCCGWEVVVTEGGGGRTVDRFVFVSKVKRRGRLESVGVG